MEWPRAQVTGAGLVFWRLGVLVISKTVVLFQTGR